MIFCDDGSISEGFKYSYLKKMKYYIFMLILMLKPTKLIYFDKNHGGECFITWCKSYWH